MLLPSIKTHYLGICQIILLWFHMLHSGFGASLPSVTSPNNDDKDSTFHVDKSDKSNIRQLSNIISALEDLGVLNSDKKKCYNLDRITKTPEIHEARTWKVGIHLFIQEFVREEGESLARDVEMNAGGLNDPAYTSNTLHGKRTEMDRQCLLAPKKSRGGDEGDVTNQPQLVSEKGVESEDNSTSDVGRFGEDGVKNNQTADVSTPDDGGGGLSKTQIMVISTCSTVIGVFFIVALIMRIRYHLVRENNLLGNHFRNYLKRVREEQAARRHTYRSSSVAMRGSLDGRKDSLPTSKKEDKALGHGIMRINDDRQHYNGSHLTARVDGRHEHNPLLIVTSTTDLESQTSDRYEMSKKRKHSTSLDIFELDIDPVCFFDSNKTCHLYPSRGRSTTYEAAERRVCDPPTKKQRDISTRGCSHPNSNRAPPHQEKTKIQASALHIIVSKCEQWTNSRTETKVPLSRSSKRRGRRSGDPDSQETYNVIPEGVEVLTCEIRRESDSADSKPNSDLSLVLSGSDEADDPLSEQTNDTGAVNFTHLPEPMVEEPSNTLPFTAVSSGASCISNFAYLSKSGADDDNQKLIEESCDANDNQAGTFVDVNCNRDYYDVHSSGEVSDQARLETQSGSARHSNLKQSLSDKTEMPKKSVTFAPKNEVIGIDSLSSLIVTEESVPTNI